MKLQRSNCCKDLENSVVVQAVHQGLIFSPAGLRIDTAVNDGMGHNRYLLQEEAHVVQRKPLL